MGHLGKRNQYDLLFQLNDRDLKLGVPPSGRFGTLTVDELVASGITATGIITETLDASGVTATQVDATGINAIDIITETLTVITSAILPAFNTLYVRETGISYLGTVQSGIWNGDVITEQYGGTGQSAYNIGDILYADTPSGLTTLASGATGAILITDGSGLPSWQDVLGETQGGTGQSTYAPGDILLATGVNELGTLPSGQEGTALRIQDGQVDWAFPKLVSPTGTQYNAGAADRFIMASGALLVVLPASPSVGQSHTVKDRDGLASTTGISVSGSADIDNSASFTLTADYEAASFVWNGSTWSTF